jgi:DNA-3-methyladenine glycosylase
LPTSAATSPVAPAAPAPRCTRRFYATDSQTLARRLLGQTLVRILDDGTRLAGVIVETEAYAGVVDRASHAWNGRRTARNEAMYSRAGTAYVYFTYGMHFCFNVVCGREGVPLAVLVRALEPVEGLETMRRLRCRAPGRGVKTLTGRDLCSGPGKLCQALAIDRSFSGIDLTAHPRLFLERTGRRLHEEQMSNTPRIGIGFAGDWAARPLRWFMKGNPHVSRGPLAGGALKNGVKRP